MTTLTTDRQTEHAVEKCVAVGRISRTRAISPTSFMSAFFREFLQAFDPVQEGSIHSLAWLGLRQGTFICVGWQMTLGDPIWQMTLCSSEVGFS